MYADRLERVWCRPSYGKMAVVPVTSPGLKDVETAKKVGLLMMGVEPRLNG